MDNPNLITLSFLFLGLFVGFVIGFAFGSPNRSYSKKGKVWDEDFGMWLDKKCNLDQLDKTKDIRDEDKHL